MPNTESIDFYNLFSPKNTSCFDGYGKAVKTAYLRRVDDFFKREENIGTTASIRDVFETIKEESKMLLSKDPAFGLYGLIDYINKQKQHLSSIRLIFGRQDITYESIVTFVVKVALFDIDEANFLRDYSNQKHGFMIVTVTHEKIMWEAIKSLDNFDMLLAYKHDVYDKKREEYKGMCILRKVDVRTAEQKKKDNISYTLDEMSGCIFILVFFLICMIIGSLIK